MPKFLDIPEFYDSNGILTEPTAYDVIIRTQEDFDALLASDNGWFGAHSVLFDGEKGITFVFNCSDINVFSIPNTVLFINGVNGATIKFQSTASSTSISGPKYSGSAPSNAFLGNLNFTIQPSSSNSGTNYFFQGMKNIVNCSVTANVGVSTSDFKLLIFGTCQNIINTKVSIETTTDVDVIGFENCGNIYNCDVSLTCETSGSGQCFTQCYNLIGCSAETSGSFETHMCYYDSNRLTNCTGTIIDSSPLPGTVTTVFNLCEFLSNCSAELTSYNHITTGCFFNCQKLSNCVCESIVGQLSHKIAYGFNNCSYCNGCVKGENGTFTNYQLWYGDNTNVDWDSCDKPDDYQLPYTNPNLLINPDFRINQRGKTSYTILSTSKSYTVDRWCLQYTSGGNIDVQDEGGRLNYAADLLQYIEDYKKLSNKTLTLSIKWKSYNSGVNYSPLRVSFVYWKNGVYTLLSDSDITIKPNSYYADGRIDTATFNVPDLEDSTAAAIRIYSNKEIDSSYTYNTDKFIYWVKLELGSVATHFISPDQGIELLKCQRFFQKITLHGGATASSGTTTVYAAIPIPTTMRANPTITVNKMPDLRGNGISTKPSSISFQGLYNNFLQINVQATGLTGNHVYALSNGEIFADAEI